MSIVISYNLDSIRKAITSKLISRSISYAELAAAIKSTKSGVFKLINGNTKKIDLLLLKRIIVYLNLDYKSLLYPNAMNYIQEKEVHNNKLISSINYFLSKMELNYEI